MRLSAHQPTQGNIFWLASYPKSGNTWTRAVISSLVGDAEAPVNINKLSTNVIASNREWLEFILGFDIDERHHDYIDQLRPSAYRWWSQQQKEPSYIKIHDAFSYLPDGNALIPSDATRGVLYIIRNPLDVAVSLANHYSWPIDKTIQSMKVETSLAKNVNNPYQQVRQHLLSWSEHVVSWINAPDIRLQVVRYEDMHRAPFDTFRKIAHFLALPDDSESINRAITNCAFSRLQAQEQHEGFIEKAPKSERFFRKGVVGDGQATLTAKQIQTIIHDHAEIMQRFGYLD